MGFEGGSDNTLATPGRHQFVEHVLDRAIAVGCLIGTYERAAPEVVGHRAEIDADLCDVGLRLQAGVTP